MSHHLQVYDDRIEDIEHIRDLLTYNPHTGEIHWRKPKMGRQFFKQAGTVDKNGYRRIMINYRMYLAHRLAFVIMEGRWPREIDHIDRNPANMVWSNLRECTRSENLYNRGSWSWGR